MTSSTPRLPHADLHTPKPETRRCPHGAILTQARAKFSSRCEQCQKDRQRAYRKRQPQDRCSHGVLKQTSAQFAYHCSECQRMRHHEQDVRRGRTTRPFVSQAVRDRNAQVCVCGHKKAIHDRGAECYVMDPTGRYICDCVRFRRDVAHDQTKGGTNE